MDRSLLAPSQLQMVADLSESSESCSKGWLSEHNKKGNCCCNCVWQNPINAHPWNKQELTKGPISKIIGWGCGSPDLYPFITFFDTQHGMCEMHSRNKHEY